MERRNRNRKISQKKRNTQKAREYGGHVYEYGYVDDNNHHDSYNYNDNYSHHYKKHDSDRIVIKKCDRHKKKHHYYSCHNDKYDKYDKYNHYDKYDKYNHYKNSYCHSYDRSHEKYHVKDCCLAVDSPTTITVGATGATGPSPGNKILYNQKGDCFTFTGRVEPVTNTHLNSEISYFEVPLRHFHLPRHLKIDPNATSGNWVACSRNSQGSPGEGVSNSGNMYLEVVDGMLRFIIRNNYAAGIESVDTLRFEIAGKVQTNYY